MLTVLIFVALMLTFFSICHRYSAEAVRIETARSQMRQRDEGAIHATAAALDLLETGRPPVDPYSCHMTVDTLLGPKKFTVTFTAIAPNDYSIHTAPSSPMDSSPPMPSNF